MRKSLKETSINPMWVAPAILIPIVVLLYVFVIGPQMAENAAAKNFNSPEAQALRDPANHKLSEDAKASRDRYMAKERLAARPANN